MHLHKEQLEWRCYSKPEDGSDFHRFITESSSNFVSLKEISAFQKSKSSEKIIVAQLSLLQNYNFTFILLQHFVVTWTKS